MRHGKENGLIPHDQPWPPGVILARILPANIARWAVFAGYAGL
jgi:hypothetical protein